MKVLERTHITDTRALFERAAPPDDQPGRSDADQALEAAGQEARTVSEDPQTGLRTIPQRSSE